MSYLAKKNIANSRLTLHMSSLACWEYHTRYVGGDLWLSEAREFRALKTRARRKAGLIIPLSRNLFSMVCMHRDLKFTFFRTTQHSFMLSLLCM